MDLSLAFQQAQAVENALGRLLPDQAEMFKENLGSLTDDLAALAVSAVGQRFCVDVVECDVTHHRPPALAPLGYALQRLGWEHTTSHCFWIFRFRKWTCAGGYFG